VSIPIQPLAFCSLFVLLNGCDQTELTEAWQLDRLRVLGVRAQVAGEPDPVLGYRAEPEPGETTTFESLVYVPKDTTLELTSWFACLPDASSPYGAYGCEPDPELMSTLEALNPADIDFNDPAVTEELLNLFEQAKEAGLIGMEPLYPPEWQVPDDALDGLTDAQRLEGRIAFINLSAVPSDAIDESDLELAFKRVPVSEAKTPNHNPDIVDILVANQSLVNEAGFTAKRNTTYRLEPVLAQHHIETYAFNNDQGDTKWRVEQPYFNWYSEDGVFDQPTTLHPYTTVEWTAPKAAGLISIYVVVRDRRGGMGWRQLLVNVL
jgi:hypothetical protein